MLKEVKQESIEKKVRSFNSFFVITPNLKNDRELYFTSYCAPLNATRIKIYSIELKLTPYDTALFSTKLILLQQQQSGDTLVKIIEIKGEEIKNKKYVLNLKNENILLEPSNYYIGYAFIPKKLDKPYDYRVYQNDNGLGALIFVNGDDIKVQSGQNFNYNFPFKISYITL